MRIKIIIIIAVLVSIGFLSGLHAQTAGEKKLMQARLLMSDYRDASLFRDMSTGGYDPSWEITFRNIFQTNKIIFDVPFRAMASSQVNSTEESRQDKTIRLYLEEVTPDRYIEIIRNAYALYQLTNFSYQFFETAVDTSGLSTTGRIMFEYRKIFDDTSWSVRESRAYVFEISFLDGEPKISSVTLVNEDISRSQVELRFESYSSRRQQEYLSPAELFVRLRIDVDQNIQSSFRTAFTDSLGLIRLGMIPDRASLIIDTVFGVSGQRYSVPADWKRSGQKVSNQPSGGFRITLLPYTWNGLSFTVRGFGGFISPDMKTMKNFTENSGFYTKTGISSGFGIEVAKYFRPGQVIDALAGRNKPAQQSKPGNPAITYAGLGSGILFYHYRHTSGSNGFRQLPYQYLDRLGNPVNIVVSADRFNERFTESGIMLPVYIDFRRQIAPVASFPAFVTLQTGIDFFIPIRSAFTTDGVFSRHGFYENYNTQPVTNDSFYNYYTAAQKTQEETIINNSIESALFLRIGGLFNLSKGKTDNLFDVGLKISAPFGNKPAGYDQFLLVSGNDEFNSFSSSGNRKYRYFVGLSIGYNFINYRIN